MSFVLPTAVDSIAATTMYLAIFAILLISFHGSRMLLIFIARIIYFFVARYASCMINQFSDMYVLYPLVLFFFVVVNFTVNAKHTSNFVFLLIYVYDPRNFIR